MCISDDDTDDPAEDDILGNILPLCGLNAVDTALFEAVRQNSVLAVQAALDAGANVNARNRMEETPLHWAATYAQGAVVQLLLDHDANPNAYDKKDETPLHICAVFQKFALADVLLAGGANIEAQKDPRAKTPLWSAFVSDLVTTAGEEGTRFFLEKGANPHVQVFSNGAYRDLLNAVNPQSERGKKFTALVQHFIDNPVKPHHLRKEKPVELSLVPDEPPAKTALEIIQEIGRENKHKFKLKPKPLKPR